MRLRILLLSLLTTAGAHAQESLDLILNRLAKVEQFAFGPIGFAGRISQGEQDFDVIIARPAAEADFEEVYSTGNLPAKLYALVAIHALNPTRYMELSLPLRDSTEKVDTGTGCIISYELPIAVIKQIDAGAYPPDFVAWLLAFSAELTVN